MEGIVRGFIDNSLAPSTRLTYRQGTLQYYKFCSIYHVSPPFPLTEPILCSFISHLATVHLAPQTIKTYLAAVKHMHITLGFPDLTTSGALKLVQKGIARHHAQSDRPSHTRLPMTPSLLGQVKVLWQPHQYEFDYIMLEVYVRNRIEVCDLSSRAEDLNSNCLYVCIIEENER